MWGRSPSLLLIGAQWHPPWMDLIHVCGSISHFQLHILLDFKVPIFNFCSFSRLCSYLVIWLSTLNHLIGYLHFNSGSLGQTPFSPLIQLPIVGGLTLRLGCAVRAGNGGSSELSEEQ